MKKPKFNPFEGDPRPRIFETDTSAEFFDICARARAGEFVMWRISVGRSNGTYVIDVRYPTKYSPQMNLL